MTNYFLGFVRFWRHFIVGDDGIIAVTVMWTLLLTWALAKNYSNIWVVVPVCVTVLMTTVIYRRVAKGAVSDVAPTQRSLLQLAVLPFVGVLTIPLVIFRITNDQASIETILLPVALFCLTALVFWWPASRVFHRFPVMTIFLFGVLAYLVTLVWQPYYIRFASELYQSTDPIVSSFVALVAIAVFLNACVKTWQTAK